MSLFFPIIDPVHDTQFNFDLLEGLLMDTGGAKLNIRSGITTLTFAAGSGTSVVTTVSHGMSSTPAGIIAFQNSVGGPAPVVAQASNITSTSFDLYGEFRTGTWVAGGTINFFWLAIG